MPFPEPDSIPDSSSPETGFIPDGSSPEADSISNKLGKIKLTILGNHQDIIAMIKKIA